jgi:cyclohexanecarboxylate-CoA ligase
MILASAEHIAEYTARGIWGSTTIDDLFRAAVIGGRDRLAIADASNKADFMSTANLRLSWVELADLVDALSLRLADAGIGRDDVVGVQLPNCVELAAVYLAAARLGFILSPFPIQYRAHELADLLPFAGATAFITARNVKGHDAGAMIAEAVPSVATILAWGGPSDGAIQTLDDLAPPDRVRLAAIAARAGVTANDILTITWTSGTEARPKGVPRSHNYWITAGQAVAEAGELRDGDTLLNPFPMVHLGSLGGMFFPWLIKRGVLVQHQPFDLDVFLRQIAEEKIAYTVAPPAILALLRQNTAVRTRYDLSSLRSLGTGSAPLSPEVMAWFEDVMGLAVWNTFGSSEGCAIFGGRIDVPDPALRATYLPRWGVPDIDFASRASRLQETRLVDPATGLVATEAGQSGELRLRGPYVFGGYWNAPELTAAAFDTDGYFRTGDMFELAGDGAAPRYYRFIGRNKEVINRGGVKISPAEIEGLLETHPNIREAAVIGMQDPRLGEKVCAVVATRDGGAIALEDVLAHLNGLHIAIYKLPEHLIVLPALPRNPVGKILKRELVAPR